MCSDKADMVKVGAPNISVSDDTSGTTLFGDSPAPGAGPESRHAEAPINPNNSPSSSKTSRSRPTRKVEELLQTEEH